MTDIFSDIIGHDTVKKGLLHAVSHGRLHHALLLTGPSGIGKTMLIRRFIQAMYCVESTPADLHRCGRCSQCRRILSKTHPDVIDIETDAATLKIEVIRELQRKLAFPPFESDRRFVIIQDVHKMQDAAANCLLKTLEEPEPHTTFVLVTPQIQRLLPTIVSRCQTIRFAPFEYGRVAEFLVSQGHSPEMANQIAALSGGSFGVALELAAGDYQKELLEAFEHILSTDSAIDAFSVAAGLKGDKNMSGHLLSLLMTYIRDMLVLKTAPDAPIILGHYRDRMTSRLDKISAQSADRASKLIQEIQEAFIGNVNELVAWEHLTLGMHGILFDA